MRRARAALAALAASAMLVLSGCTAAPAVPTTSTSTPVPATHGSSAPAVTGAADPADTAAVERFYQQRLVWTRCHSTFQCATATAPLDWAHPAGATIHLALIRKPASGQRLGSLFVNPGGPGASAVDFVESGVGNMDAAVQQHYDVIGFDPPGVGYSSAVDCYNGPQLDQYLFGVLAGSYGSAQWLTADLAAQKKFAQACLKNTGPLLGHVDTATAARDMDMLRADVGDVKLNYFGFSYGTLLGSTYAGLFPKNVGRMVLDGVIDPAENSDETALGQAQGFESNLEAYLTQCLSGSDADCPFHGTVDEALTSIAGLMRQLDAHPIVNSDGRRLGSGTFFTAIATPLYDSSEWPELDALFTDVQRGSAKVAFLLADSYSDRNSDGTYADNLLEAYQAINCLDYPTTPTPADEARLHSELLKVAPLFAPYFEYNGYSCVGWPFTATRRPAPIAAAGSGPILVVGTTGDPATPYSGAVALAHELQNGHLVTWHGYGHTAYGRSNTCVTDTVDGYLISGTVPATDPEC